MDCDALITGFASKFGPPETNLEVSRTRATNVAALLEGLKILSSLKVVAGGGTDEFGSAAADNRLVRVELSKP